MNVVKKIKKEFFNAISNLFPEKSLDFDSVQFTLNVDKNRQNFGDLSCNFALVLAGKLQLNPKEIALKIVNAFNSSLFDKSFKDYIEKIEIAGPGFLNLTFTSKAWHEIVKQFFESKENFFKQDNDQSKVKYLIEFVSANPTGPLHLGHGRGGIIGDTLARVLNFLGHNAQKEFYINDAGNQIQKLGESLKIRCQQELGLVVELPEDGYKGEYMIDLAKLAVKEFGQKLLDKDDKFFSDYAKEIMLDLQKQDLKDYGIEFDKWFSERTLHDSGQVEKVILELKEKDLVYENEGALWFRSSTFGDDKDRVVRKSTGELTYIAADIAYHKNKFERDFDKLIDILGQDHHGYVNRLKATVDALGFDSNNLDVVLYQLVSIKNAGQVERMSKRAGKFTTLREIIDTVGKDVARFFYLHRKAEAHLEFDLAVALKKTDENPVFYIQYAYVRINSILKKAELELEFKDFVNNLINNKLSKNEVDICLNSLCQQELDVIKKLLAFGEILISIEKTYQTHLLSYYMVELANIFHAYYSGNKVIDKENINLSKARMFTLNLVNMVFVCGLDLLGVEKPEHM
ncbi:arginine--tRNA ligase [Candidatus Dependentiae bacterium]|nr:arginine--tRNA ligase [Candidatus Dependentiae bacterium]